MIRLNLIGLDLPTQNGADGSLVIQFWAARLAASFSLFMALIGMPFANPLERELAVRFLGHPDKTTAIKILESTRREFDKTRANFRERSCSNGSDCRSLEMKRLPECPKYLITTHLNAPILSTSNWKLCSREGFLMIRVINHELSPSSLNY